MSEFESLSPHEEQQLMFRAQVDGMRRAQQRHAQAVVLPPGHGAMTPTAKYFDIPLVEDDDYYFLGHPGDAAPFWATPRPAYFDDFEAACQQDDVAKLQQVTAQHALTPAVLHHGLTLALASGSVASARELLLRGAPIAKRTPERILSGPTGQQTALFDLLAAQGWEPSHHLFMQVIPSIPLLRWFLSHGIDPNYGVKRDTSTKKGGPSHECADALEFAAYKGSAEAIEILIEAGAKITYGTPLHSAAGALPPRGTPYTDDDPQRDEFDLSRLPAMEALVKHGADVNQREITQHLTPQYPIIYAVHVGATQRARWLLDHGANPELSGPYGSAVEYASRVGSKEMRDLFTRSTGTS